MIQRLTSLLAAVALCAGLAPNDAAAVPAAAGTFALRQPDGRLVAARVTGDEWDHAIETLDGYTILRDPTSAAWVYATRDRAGALVPSGLVVGVTQPLGLTRKLRSQTASLQGEHAAAPPSPDTVGRPMAPLGAHKLLVIVVDFTPSISHGVTEEQLARHFFGGDPDTSTSVADYWKTVSYDKLTIAPAAEANGTHDDGIVAVTLPDDLPACASERLGPCHPNLARQALIAADPFVDFASFDGNHDEVLDVVELHVMIVLRGREAAFRGPDDNCGRISVWAHRGAFNDVDRAPRLDDVLVGDYRGAPVAGKTRGGYMMEGEWHDRCDERGHAATIGVAVHELGHDLGLPDLSNREAVSYGVGAWSVMSTGAWGRTDGPEGSLPVWPDAHSRWLLGFIEPVAVERTSRDVELSPIENAGAGDADVRLAPATKVTPWGTYATSDGCESGAGEYFLFENRQQIGYDEGLPGSGLLIWHVSEDACSPNLPDESEGGRVLVALEQADGRFDLACPDNDHCNSGDATDPWPATPPKNFDAASTPSSRFYSGEPSGLVVTDIVAADGIVTADLLLPECGNGFREDGEECDDGNVVSGDGCGTTCDPEQCWTCNDEEPSLCAPIADGTPCNDNDLCTVPDTCQAGTCIGPDRDCDDHVSCTTDGCSPRDGCTHVPDHTACAACETCSRIDGCLVGPRPIVAAFEPSGCWESDFGTSKLVVKDASRDGNDRVSWHWGRGIVPALTLGDPTASTDYNVCLFDPAGDLLFSATASAAASCDGEPCWTRYTRGVFRYRDPKARQNGLAKVVLIPGFRKRAEVTVVASGEALTLPPLPLGLPVTMQLQTDLAGCWSSTFGSDRTQRNNAVRFKGSGS